MPPPYRGGMNDDPRLKNKTCRRFHMTGRFPLHAELIPSNVTATLDSLTKTSASLVDPAARNTHEIGGEIRRRMSRDQSASVELEAAHIGH